MGGDIMDNARVTFMELVGCAVVKNSEYLHLSLVSEHVDKVFSRKQRPTVDVKETCYRRKRDLL